MNACRGTDVAAEIGLIVALGWLVASPAPRAVLMFYAIPNAVETWRRGCSCGGYDVPRFQCVLCAHAGYATVPHSCSASDDDANNRRHRRAFLGRLSSTLAIFQISQSPQVTDFAALQVRLLPFERSGRRPPSS